MIAFSITVSNVGNNHPMYSSTELSINNPSFAEAAKQANRFISTIADVDNYEVKIYTFYYIGGRYRHEYGHNYCPTMTAKQFLEQFGDIR